MRTGVAVWMVQRAQGGKSQRITLGPVGTLGFEGPPDQPGAADLASIALKLRGAARIRSSRSAAPSSRSGITLGRDLEGLRRRGLSAAERHRPQAREHRSRATAIAGASILRRIEDEPAADFDTRADAALARHHRRAWARESHALIMLKGLLRFGASRGLVRAAQDHDHARGPSRQGAELPEARRTEAARRGAGRADRASSRSASLGFAALRLLLHTGMRKGEVLTSNGRPSISIIASSIWNATRRAARTSGRDVLLSDAAVEVLRSLPRLARGGFVFFGRRREGHLVDLEYFWEQALERGQAAADPHSRSAP